MTVGKVKDFNFGSSGKTVGLCKGGMATKGYAKGGAVVEKATGERYASRKEMIKHEREETPRMQREELVQKASVRAPARRSVPVASQTPMVALKKGGMAGKKC